MGDISEAKESLFGVEDNHAPGAARTGSSTSSDWDVYLRGRPAYPPSLENLILDYHQRHGGTYSSAHDMGAGNGVYGRTLAKHFSRVHTSDINTSAVAAAKEQLSAWKRQTNWPGTFTFSINAAERAHEHVAAGSVDLALMLESAHWTNAAAMIDSVATTLAPGGTLALVYYHPIPRVLGNPLVDAAVQRLFEAWSRRPMEKGRPATRLGQMQINLGLDFVPLPEDLFDRDATRRININTHGRGLDAFAVGSYRDLLPDPLIPETLSRVEPGESVEERTERDEEGHGWHQELPASFFRNELATVVHSEETLRSFEPLLMDVEQLVQETTSTNTVLTEWTVAVILATRK